jgi:hypothetical protein
MIQFGGSICSRDGRGVVVNMAWRCVRGFYGL